MQSYVYQLGDSKWDTSRGQLHTATYCNLKISLRDRLECLAFATEKNVGMSRYKAELEFIKTDSKMDLSSRAKVWAELLRELC